MAVLDRFYSAFQDRDWATMGACYHPDAHFSDPVFPDLDAAGVRAMWKMLLTSGTDLRIGFSVLEETGTNGKAEWEAHYTFSRTGRSVHNEVVSTFVLKDDLILQQLDVFDFWKWSRQALGTPGALLGWSSIIKNKVRDTAAKGLAKSKRV